MGKYIKIHSISVSLLNNAEYLNLMRRFRALIPAGTPGVDDEEEEERPGGLALTDINTQVGITDGELEAFDADVEKLGDAVNQSRVSNETAQMAEADKERDDLVVYFNATVSNERKSPIQARRDAAVELYNVTKVYVHPDPCGATGDTAGQRFATRFGKGYEQGARRDTRIDGGR